MSLRRLLSLSFFFLIAAGLSAQKTHRKLIYFQSEAAALTPESTQSLSALYEYAPDSISFQFELMGLVNQRQSASEISALMEDRASELKTFFTSRGVNPEYVTTTTAPLNAFLLSDESKRADISSYAVNVFLVKPPRKAPKKAAPTPIAQAFPKKARTYRHDAQKKLKVECREGTKLSAPKNTFVFEDGTLAEGEVEIVVKEFYKTSDILMADLTTTCNGHMIESGGMLHISASCQGREVFIADGKKLSIELPTEATGSIKKTGMELFMGQQQNGVVDWQLASQLTNKRGKGQRKNKKYYENMLNGDSSTLNMLTVDTAALWNDININRNLNVPRNWNQNDMNVDNRLNVVQSKGDEYLLETSDLGWINCDRFIEDTEKAPLYVKVDTTHTPAVRLVFKDINSVMRGWYNSSTNQYDFTGLPVGRKATLIAYSIVDGKAYFDMQEVKVTKSGIATLDLAEMSEEDMKRNLKKLNRG